MMPPPGPPNPQGGPMGMPGMPGLPPPQAPHPNLPHPGMPPSTGLQSYMAGLAHGIHHGVLLHAHAMAAHKGGKR